MRTFLESVPRAPFGREASIRQRRYAAKPRVAQRTLGRHGDAHVSLRQRRYTAKGMVQLMVTLASGGREPPVDATQSHGERSGGSRPLLAGTICYLAAREFEPCPAKPRVAQRTPGPRARGDCLFLGIVPHPNGVPPDGLTVGEPRWGARSLGCSRPGVRLRRPWALLCNAFGVRAPKRTPSPHPSPRWGEGDRFDLRRALPARRRRSPSLRPDGEKVPEGRMRGGLVPVDLGTLRQTPQSQRKRGQRLGQTAEVVAGAPVAQIEIPSDDRRSLKHGADAANHDELNLTAAQGADDSFGKILHDAQPPLRRGARIRGGASVRWGSAAGVARSASDPRHPDGLGQRGTDSALLAFVGKWFRLSSRHCTPDGSSEKPEKRSWGAWRLRDRPAEWPGDRALAVRDRHAGGLRRDRAAGETVPGADQRRREVAGELVRGARRGAGRCVAGAAAGIREWTFANISEFVGWVKPTDSIQRPKKRSRNRERARHRGTSPAVGIEPPQLTLRVCSGRASGGRQPPVRNRRWHLRVCSGRQDRGLTPPARPSRLSA
jgi:hypothetical protein